jgi:hypothetical protein
MGLQEKIYPEHIRNLLSAFSTPLFFNQNALDAKAFHQRIRLRKN